MRYTSFTSFDEINHRLQVLKLTKEIELEKLKLDGKLLKRHISPKYMVGRIGTASKISLLGTINKWVQKIPL